MQDAMLQDNATTLRSSHNLGLLVWISLLVFLAALVPNVVMANNPSQSAKLQKTTIVAFGDSLTAGYNLPPDKSFPAQLEKSLRSEGYNVTILNAGVSGDTTAAGLARFDWAVPQNVAGAILELGANDALRGINPTESHANLSAILKKLKARKIPTLLMGMRAPGNWGAAYTKEFDAMYAKLARQYGATLYPFFLEGVALKPELNLADGMHPNAAGIAEIVKRVQPFAVKLLDTIAERRR